MLNYRNFHGRVIRVSRLQNSVNGNPRWSLSLLLGDGALHRFVTPIDAGWVYGKSWQWYEGLTAFVTVGPRKNSRTIESIKVGGI